MEHAAESLRHTIRALIPGATMKRFAVRQWLILFALVSLTSAAVFGQQTSAPPAEKHPATQQDQKDQKDGTGVVPPGVKLDPQMPGPGAPTPFHFPSAATKTLPNGLTRFRGQRSQRTRRCRETYHFLGRRHRRPGGKSRRRSDDRKPADAGNQAAVGSRHR